MKDFITHADKLFASAGFSEKTLGAVAHYFSYGGDIKINTEMKHAHYGEERLNEFATNLFSTVQIIPALRTTIKFFLACEKYHELYAIMRMSTITDAYTSSRYTSPGEYTFEERSFDRFIRIVQTCKIEPTEYMGFMTYLMDAAHIPAAAWSRPVKVFLKTQDAKFLFSYAESTKSLNAYQLLLEMQPEKAVPRVVNHILFGSGDRTKYIPILKPYKWLTVPATLDHLSEANNYVREQAVKILLQFKQDENVSTRLYELYDTETTVRIKQLIGGAYGISMEVLKINSFAELLAYAQKVGVAAPKRFPELKYKNGAEVSEEVAGAVLALLDDGKCALPKLLEVREITKFIDDNSLTLAATEIYPHNDYSRLAFSLLYGDEEIVRREVERQEELISTYDFNTRKFQMLGLSTYRVARDYLFSVLRREEHKKYHKHAWAAIELAALSVGLSVDDLEDENVQTLGLDMEGKKQGSYGIISITPSLTVESDPRDIELAKEVESELKQQSKRMERAMIEGRRFTLDCFTKHIVSSPILNKIASTLFFGEYKYGKLKNVFIVEGGIRDLKNQPYTPSEELDIMICHPIDLSEWFGKRKFNLVQAFPQVDREFFTPTNPELNKNAVERFASFLLPTNDIIRLARANSFSLSTDDRGYYTHFGKQYGDITAIICFKDAINPERNAIISLGEIRYYQGTSVRNFTRDKKCVNLASVDKRTFSESVYDVGKIARGNN